MFGQSLELTVLLVISQVDVHLSKFIADLVLRQAGPLLPSHTHTLPPGSTQPHATALTLPLVLPNALSQHDSSPCGSLQTQERGEDLAVSTGDVLVSTYECRAASGHRGSGCVTQSL